MSKCQSANGFRLPPRYRSVGRTHGRGQSDQSPRCRGTHASVLVWAPPPHHFVVRDPAAVPHSAERRQTGGVTKLRPAENAEPARWLLRTGAYWWDLVRYGPPVFDAYVRIALDDGTDRDGEQPALRTALATLADHTTTPAGGYAAIWEGWTSSDPAPEAPPVAIPHRAMLLFAGPIDELRDAPALAWYGSVQGVYQEPHLVWPEDQAWCLACEVDEEIEFTVGCSVPASQALAKALPGAVRRVAYGASAPLYGD